MRVRFGGFGLNPLTWCAWALAAIAAALMERNPYLQLLLLAILLTVWIAARHHRSIGYWRAALVLGLLPILFSLVFSRFGSHVLFRLPSHLPVIGGPWTVEATLYGASTGAALLLTMLVFAIAQTRLRTADLLAVLPRPLYRLGTLVALALALVPQALASLQAVSETRRLRGVRAGWRTGLGLLLPVLLTTLERALQYAESLDARGFGSQRRTRYHPSRWGLADGLVLLGAIGALAATILAPSGYDPYLQLAPGLPQTALIVWLVPLSIPAWLNAVSRRAAVDHV
ncbi:MAG TPA: energy-coupling factor transporter transmembrane protein EcfT [Candidatus Limnocylindria bacterium]|nr:energy-coupling factor transporter transmembrane protein EcfT [Candidatus Limnocylindria bacterium]